MPQIGFLLDQGKNQTVTACFFPDRTKTEFEGQRLAPNSKAYITGYLLFQGGGGTDNEMCGASVHFYPKQATDMFYCSSNPIFTPIAHFLGITEMEDGPVKSLYKGFNEKPSIKMKNGDIVKYMDYLNKKVDWDSKDKDEIELSDKFEEIGRDSTHFQTCISRPNVVNLIL